MTPAARTLMGPDELETAFLHGILEEPDDDLRRLVFADWLMERGDPRGEFIHVQVESARLGPADPHQDALRNRARELLKRHAVGWRCTPPDRVRVEFRRGLMTATARGWGGAEHRWVQRPGVWLQRVTLAEVSDADLRAAASSVHLARTPELEVFGDDVTDLGVAHLSGLSRLRKLSLWGAHVTPTVLRYLSGLPSLRELHVTGVNLRQADLSPLSRLGELCVLVLGQCGITDEGVAALAALPRLTKLELSKSEVGTPGLRHLGGLRELRSLNLNWTRVTDETLQELARLGSLQTLDLADTRVTDAGLEALGGLTGLRELGLSRTRVVGPGLAHLTELPHLEALDLSREPTGTPFTDEGLPYLTRLRGLRDLRLFGTRITDDGLRHLTALTGLRRLDLRDVRRLTDDGLVHLAGLTELRSLSLDWTRVREAGVTRLRRALPNCHITWGGGRP